ncbi:hypothetical protein CLAFUW4_06529 [Fulvia fulva]|uniref:Uncharacterized protein n=1 Tax=Passalora fulva TaxID=5499 RepID=A0A9Q8LJ27_PASFU|nr:uncharacterized protein CLAFUR5_06677 [Fulvia fulva]KAK4622177.1 hypothetical protein CLAFUR4_06537 [Fulvia fulva]KAK4623176.1 hypothetical protein CLAFUR0_06533 [Fulvia fulva]UJO18427.1 hypothetical protein CLAFUR5_06677 [Fulvia fulva]WPV15810.1 hypothetical protein CLAFUW4_06529 [Fulvia fulva]WPV31364.1 hypothetical protein CLAFUW7_06528 [Fulvia fulva]
MFSLKFVVAITGLATLVTALDDIKNCYCAHPIRIGKASDPPAIEAVCNTYGTLKKDSGGYTTRAIMIEINEPLFFSACTAQNGQNTANWCA